MSLITSAISHGKTHLLIDVESAPISETKTVYNSIETDAVLVSLYADTVVGTLDVSVYTLTEEGKELLIVTFPSITSATSSLLLKKGAACMSRLKFVAVYSAGTTFEVRARGIAAGETSVKILGASEGKASQKTITTIVSALITASLIDRSGLVLKNVGTPTIYLGYSSAETTPSTGYPISPGESLGIDLAAGATLYAVAASGSADIRIMEAAI